MTPSEWTLLALDQAGDRGLTPVQLQKVLFLLGQQVNASVLGPGYYQFVAYDYGPFCKKVYSDAEALAQEGLVQIVPRTGQKWSEYRITEAGRDTAKTIASSASAGAITYLRELVEWASRLSFQELVRAIYKKYPAYKVNSVFQD